MATTKSALGRGMSAVLKSTAHMSESKTGPIEPNGILLIPLNKIEANKDQPRKVFKDKDLLELSKSIKESGVIQPISVNQVNGKYMIIAGERRYRASKLAGLDKIPAIVKNVTKKDILVMSIVENVQRSDLNCIEEGLAYYQLMNEFNLTQEEVAKKVGKERSTVANFLRILRLPREVAMMLQREELSMGHGKILAGLKDDEKIVRLAREAVTNKLSVRDLELLAKKKLSSNLRNTQTKIFDAKLDSLKAKLERKTGYHFDLKTKNNGSGSITIKFSNEAEFNDIFEYLTNN